MIAFLSGVPLSIDGIVVTLFLESSGIGYDIYAAPSIIADIRIGVKKDIWIHHHKTDVSESLFGFETFEERSLFRELNRVNGVGGKTALALLALGRDDLIKAIQFEDDKLLSSVPGIGKKTAQKIIVDLKGSIDFSKKTSTSDTAKSVSSNNTLVISSLVQMGYDKTRVESIVETLDTSLPLGEKVKESIKELSR